MDEDCIKVKPIPNTQSEDWFFEFKGIGPLKLTVTGHTILQTRELFKDILRNLISQSDRFKII